MKVMHDTYEVLILEDRPWVFGIMMIAVALIMAAASMHNLADGHRGPGIASGLFALAMILMFPLFIRRAMLTFDRVSGTITLTKRSTRKQTTQEFALSDLQGAEVLTSTNSDGDEFHSVRLHVGEASVPFTDTASSGDDAAEMADTINAWLQLDSPAPAA